MLRFINSRGEIDMAYNEKYFELAYNLAEKGRGKTSPNPFVGAVIVKDDKIVGKGFTQSWGKDHAEIQAIKEAGDNCNNAEMYVTLEPCSHFGKTPPCSDQIIKAGISKVYAGMKDPNPLVNGKGFKKLKDANIEIVSGIWNDKIKKQLEYYLSYIKKERPFVVMKNAVSLDGKIATESGFSKWITGIEARKEVHLLRNEMDVIVTGIGTILNDNPLLNVRLENKSNHPVRVILDDNLRTPIDTKIVQTANDIQTFICKSEHYINQEKEIELKKWNVNVMSLPKSKNGLDLKALLNELYKKNYYSVMIEAGDKLSSSFLREKLVDKIYYYIAPKIIGGDFGIFKNISIKDMNNVVNIEVEKLDKIEKDFRLIGYLKYN
ncbi:MAG: bifunctional diaminohydroxyphosphoribosylaminopyrimidine deaminase/5-amino-6-(5-phosphoribosylamino)uracil reductase RibD [Bacteroidetes bacterium]|nr:MAG: bifunctional diaminohydroxyphosphoribosylaminopyrimidine deaminase/5-amino-6-(5-phosphoribosylamino)uracil reductase RibD [Bacteroidota bacterium]